MSHSQPVPKNVLLFVCQVCFQVHNGRSIGLSGCHADVHVCKRFASSAAHPSHPVVSVLYRATTTAAGYEFQTNERHGVAYRV